MITSQMVSIAKFLNSRFVYTPDPKGRDRWRFMKDDTVMRGDCEDYSLYIAKCLSGSVLKLFWNILIRKCKLHFVTVKGDGHLILEWDGHYIDNIRKQWSTKEQMESFCVFQKRMMLPVVIVKLIIGKIMK